MVDGTSVLLLLRCDWVGPEWMGMVGREPRGFAARGLGRFDWQCALYGSGLNIDQRLSGPRASDMTGGGGSGDGESLT